MMFIRAASAGAAVLCVCSGLAEAARSRLACIDLVGAGKQITPEGIAETGPGQFPEAIVAIRSARIRVVDALGGTPQLRITKSTLTPQQAYGAGLTNGYSGGGPVNPTGPWVGLMWPYRDFNDGYVPSTPVRLAGNDVGTIAPIAGVAGQIAVTGIQAEMAYSLTDPATFRRGLPGNGGSDFVGYFSIDIRSTSSVERMVTVFLEDVEVLAVLSDENGRLFTQIQQAEDVSISFMIPSPTAAPVLAGLGLLAVRRRRTA